MLPTFGPGSRLGTTCVHFTEVSACLSWSIRTNQGYRAMTDPVRWFEALGCVIFLAGSSAPLGQQTRTSEPLIEFSARCSVMSEWSIMLQPWRTIELEGGSLGRHRRG